MIELIVEFKNQEIKFCEKIRGLKLTVEFKTKTIECLTNKLEILKKEKEGLDSKLTGFQSASKDIDNLLESQRSDKNKEGLGYSIVHPPPAQVYFPLKKDMSWARLPEFADDTITDYSRPLPTIETDRLTEIKVETVKKLAVKYVEMYKRTSKSSNFRGNQRNWNNLKSQQLGKNFVMQNKACFNCGHPEQLSTKMTEHQQRPFQGRSAARTQPRVPAVNKRFPTVDSKSSTAARCVNTVAPRPNVNNARPKTTQDLMIILTQRVKRLERELKARTSPIKIHKVDRGRSRSVMAWVPKKGQKEAEVQKVKEVVDYILRVEIKFLAMKLEDSEAEHQV
uniref:Retrotransposon Orf1 n=1 Tax=Tanacetum cinerariifolium TaxID=118510 RepID=A0A6L2KEB8_TANCI|nr:retrotransposon Orf1 [Tanacetum cinerariifolium]